MNCPAVDPSCCRDRQQSLRRLMEDRNLDWVVVSTIEDVQWLTGVRFGWFFQAAAALQRDGTVWLVAPQAEPSAHAADQVTTYDAKWHSTLRNDQRHACDTRLRELITQNATATNFGGRIGCQYSACGGHLMHSIDAEFVDIEPDLYQLRRNKRADEIQRIKRAIAATEAMYGVAREIIRPGISEIEVFNKLQEAAVAEFDEMLTGTGNDYQCASPGGPPRGGRVAQAGELYILDLGPAFQGYFADNARTIAVTDVSRAQRLAWESIMEAFAHVEAVVRPGVSCRSVFQDVQDILDECPSGSFSHHLGHGIGLFPHEPPHLNPHWNDVFEEGDVFTAEPGLYGPELNAGIRIENDYRVTSDGVECLSNFPLELKL